MKKTFLFICGLSLSLCAFSQAILTETFDGDTIPAGWSMHSTNNTGWQVGDPSELSGLNWTIPDHDGNCAVANDDVLGQNGNSLDDELITPSLDLTDYPAVSLTFDVYSDGSYNSLGSVLISTDGGESFTEIFIIPYDENGWQTQTIGLPGSAGEENVQVAFKHTDQQIWADGLAIDNVSFFVPDVDMLSFSGITSSGYPLLNSDYEVKGTFTNTGSNAITSIHVNWSTDDGQAGDALIGGLNVAPAETYAFTHPDILTVGTDSIGLTVTITALNEVEDAVVSDPVHTVFLDPLPFVPHRKVLVEEATGTWCGYCPRGAVYLARMTDNYPDAIEVAVHNDDPMTDTVYDAGMDNTVSGYPSGLVDRISGSTDPRDFESAYGDRINVPAFVSVGVSYSFDNATRELIATVTATFAKDFTGDYRMNAIVVEDHVTGTGSDYNQHNNYAGGSLGPMGGFEDLPTFVPASQMVYHHVGRAILGGWDGTENAIPSSVVAGQEYVQTYTYQVPQEYDESEISVVGLVMDHSTGEVMNAEESSFALSANDVEAVDFDFDLYPNPAKTETTIRLNLVTAENLRYSIYDLSGKQVVNRVLGSVSPGKYLHRIPIENLHSGMYFIALSTGDRVLTRKLLVQ